MRPIGKDITKHYQIACISMSYTLFDSVGSCFLCAYYSFFLTSSLRHPKIFIKEFGDFLMPCHQHCLGVKMESVNRFMLLLLL